MAELTEASVKKLKVPELKTELTRRGLSAAGRKDDLIARLLEHVAKPNKVESNAGNASHPHPGHQDTHQDPAAASQETKDASPPATSSKDTRTPSASMPGSAASEAERRLARAARFGMATTEEERRLQRAARFGLPISEAKTPAASPLSTPAKTEETHDARQRPSSSKLSIDPAVLKRRQERFGVVNPNLEKLIARSEEEEKKRKRAERFGIMNDKGVGESKKQKVSHV